MIGLFVYFIDTLGQYKNTNIFPRKMNFACVFIKQLHKRNLWRKMNFACIIGKTSGTTIYVKLTSCLLGQKLITIFQNGDKEKNRGKFCGKVCGKVFIL
jgi:hypothetical protein